MTINLKATFIFFNIKVNKIITRLLNTKQPTIFKLLNVTTFRSQSSSLNDKVFYVYYKNQYMTNLTKLVKKYKILTYMQNFT